MREPVLLLFPPNFSFKQPYLSTPALSAYLRHVAGVPVEQRDLNIEALCYILSPSRLTNLFQCLRHFDSQRVESPEHRRAVLEALLSEDFVIGYIEEALSFLRTPHETLDIPRYSWALRIIEGALEAVSALYWPTRLTLTSFAMRYSSQSSVEILEAIHSVENPYIEFFDEEVVGSVVGGGYSLIGLSVASLCQIIPALTLAARLKKLEPSLPVVVGGGVFQRLSTGRSLPLALFDLVDFFVVGEGERPLAALHEFVEGRRSIEEVPGLVYRFGQEVLRNPPTAPVPVSELPPPDYDGLPLSSYLTPRPVLSYQPVRGCYWRQCTFCNQHVVCGDRHDEATAEKTVRDLLGLAQRYDTDAFALVNESLSPKVLRAISEQLDTEGAQLHWYAGARFDTKFDKETIELLARAGCKKLFFGLESGSPSVLKAMKKGISPKHAARILRWCRDTGVASHVYIMLGFPGERPEDIAETRRFLDDVLPAIDPRTFTIYVSIFQLKPDTKIFSDPNSFGIDEVIARTHYDLEYIYEHQTRTDSDINYTIEAELLVEHVDRQLTGLRAPEDICHFLTLGVLPEKHGEFGVPSSGTTAEVVQLNNGIQLVKPSCEIQRFVHEGKDSVLLVYDFMSSRLFTVENLTFAHALQVIARGATRAEALAVLNSVSEGCAEGALDSLIDLGLLIASPVVRPPVAQTVEAHYV